MARKKKLSTETTETTETTENKPVLSPEEKRALFAAYEAAETALQAAKAEVEVQMHARSDAVKAIYETMGAGPYRYQGSLLKAGRARGGNYIFRGQNNDNVEEI